MAESLPSNYKIELVPYRKEWVDKFTREQESLATALSAFRPRIEHIGSTSIPGALAKPIVDVAVFLETVQVVPQIVQPLAGLSYQYMGEFGLPGRHFFIKGDPRAFHLHVVDSTTDHWKRWITFRDILRKDGELLKRYQRLKASLAEIYHSDREKYTSSKSSFIDAVVDGKPALDLSKPFSSRGLASAADPD